MPKKRATDDGQLGFAAAGVDLIKQADNARRAGQLRYVDPRTLVGKQQQPRQEFEEGSLQELADSIRTYGVLQPILVREAREGEFEILAGERRQRASVLAGLDRVPVRVLVADDRTAAAITLTENLARKDLSPWEEALGLLDFREQLRAVGQRTTRDELARLVGRSAGSVSESLQIAERLGFLATALAIPRQTLTKVPKIALYRASQGSDDEERSRLLMRALAHSKNSEPASKAVAALQRRGRPQKGWSVTDRLKDRGTLSFKLRKRPEDLDPTDASAALARLTPLVEALKRRATPPE